MGICHMALTWSCWGPGFGVGFVDAEVTWAPLAAAAVHATHLTDRVLLSSSLA